MVVILVAGLTAWASRGNDWAWNHSATLLVGSFHELLSAHFSTSSSEETWAGLYTSSLSLEIYSPTYKVSNEWKSPGCSLKGLGLLIGNQTICPTLAFGPWNVTHQGKPVRNSILATFSFLLQF